MRSKISSVLLAICAFLTASGQVGVSPDELKLSNLVNDERKKTGLPVLSWNYVLAEVARDHVKAMAQHKQLSYQFPGEPLLSDRIGAKTLRFSSSSEHVASAPTVEVAHQGMINSAHDKAAILSDRYNAFGLAIVPVGSELYVVEEFAYILPVYSESQFSEGVVSAFNNARLAKGMPPLTYALIRVYIRPPAPAVPMRSNCSIICQAQQTW